MQYTIHIVIEWSIELCWLSLILSEHLHWIVRLHCHPLYDRSNLCHCSLCLNSCAEYQCWIVQDKTVCEYSSAVCCLLSIDSHDSSVDLHVSYYTDQQSVGGIMLYFIITCQGPLINIATFENLLMSEDGKIYSIIKWRLEWANYGNTWLVKMRVSEPDTWLVKMKVSKMNTWQAKMNN